MAYNTQGWLVQQQPCACSRGREASSAQSTKLEASAVSIYHWRPGGSMKSHGWKAKKLQSAVREWCTNSPATSKGTVKKQVLSIHTYAVHQKMLLALWEALSLQITLPRNALTDLTKGTPLSWSQVLSSWQSGLAITPLIGSYFWNSEQKKPQFSRGS